MIVRAVLVAVLAAALTTPIIVTAQENLAFHVPAEWKLGGPPQETRDQELIEYVRNGETFANWTALLTIQQFRRRDSLHDYLEKLKGVREAACPGVTEWTTVSEDKASLVYEWKTTAACGTEPPQWEVARLMFAKNTAYRLAFTSKIAVTPEIRESWIGALNSASLTR